MDIQVTIDACNTSINFAEPQVALEFLKMLIGAIKPEQYLSFVKAIARNSYFMDQASRLVTMCMGTPA